MLLIGKSIGWKVSSLKFVFLNESKYRAYEKNKGDHEIFVTESDRSANQDIIKKDILDTAVLSQIFEEKYEEVMNLVKTTWADKVEEYKQKEKVLDDTEKQYYLKEFKGYKKEVATTLRLIDYKYTLYHDRWTELLHYQDFEENNFHEIPDVQSLTDEEITHLLIDRATKEEKLFSEFITQLSDSLNRRVSTAKICRDLKVKIRYYPLNMTRKLILKEMVSQKAEKLIGPIKLYERGLVKVKEMDNKTQALLDTLRATILCRDPVVPLIIIEHLRNTGKLTRVKNKMAPGGDYKCIHINFCMGTSPRTIYELQVVFKEYYDLQKKDHDYYEIIRKFN